MSRVSNSRARLELGAPDVLERAGERAAELRARHDAAHKKRWGQYFTSATIARFMAELIEVPRRARVRVLDPGAGTGVLGLCVARRLLGDAGIEAVELVSVEREASAYAALRDTLALARGSLGPRLRAEAVQADVLELSASSSGLGGRARSGFDVAIANPPYFKMPPSERRGGDAPNIYARFMEVAAKLLRPGGQLCCIVPRSYASGHYFRRFRRRFHRRMQLERVHVFEARDRAFALDKVLQENVIVVYRKGELEPKGRVRISSCAGGEGLAEVASFVGAREQIAPVEGDAILSLPTCVDDLRLMSRLRGWPNTLAALGLEVSTGPVVPFRARELLVEADRPDAVPLLWLQHVRADGVRWPLGSGFRKSERILAAAGPKLLVRDHDYVLVRRFSAKEEARRLTAAPLLRGRLGAGWIGLENHLNFIHRPGAGLTAIEARGLAALLNSAVLDRYVRIASGNTQVSAAELRGLPLPDVATLAALAALADATTVEVDALLTSRL